MAALQHSLSLSRAGKTHSLLYIHEPTRGLVPISNSLKWGITQFSSASPLAPSFSWLLFPRLQVLLQLTVI